MRDWGCKWGVFLEGKGVGERGGGEDFWKMDEDEDESGDWD